MNYRRNVFKSANRFQNRLMWLIFFTLSIPLSCIVFIFVWLALQGDVFQNEAEAISFVCTVVLAVVPLAMTLIWIFAYFITNRTVGSLHRIIKELDLRIRGEKKGPIPCREGDYTHELIEKINALIDQNSTGNS